MAAAASRQLYYLMEEDDVSDVHVISVREEIRITKKPDSDVTLSEKAEQLFGTSEEYSGFYNSIPRTDGSELIVAAIYLPSKNLFANAEASVYELAAQSTNNTEIQPQRAAVDVTMQVLNGRTLKNRLVIQGFKYIPPALGVMIESSKMLIRDVARTCYGLSDEEREFAKMINPADQKYIDRDESLWVALVRGGITRSEMLNTAAGTWRDPNIMRLQLSEGKRAAAQFIRMALDIK